MTSKEILTIIEKQRAFFKTHKTKDIRFRREQLRKLGRALSKYEDEILEALFKDLHRPRTEGYAADVFSIKEEANNAVGNIRKWTSPEKVNTPLLLISGEASIVPEPYGCTLIIGPWNYPFDLTLSPLVGAIAAGNTAIVKPSEQAPHCSAVITKIIEDIYEEEFVAVIEGGVEETSTLLKEKFDYIFFTGGEVVGKIVAKAAAEYLTPVTLELGGKSPCIVDKSATLSVAAKRIAWGNCFNAGQTCISPDYLFVHEEVKDAFIEEFKKALDQFYSGNAKVSKDYTHILNKKHFDRISQLMEGGEVLVGGDTDSEKLYIEPTIIRDVTADDPIMQEEIFGPVMPLMEFNDLDTVIDFINDRPKPLALYLFSQDSSRQKQVLEETSSGGVSINDVLAHFRNKSLPFGGVGSSGIGAYHYKNSFNTFSHFKSVQKRSNIESGVEYAPYDRSLVKVKSLLQLFS